YLLGGFATTLPTPDFEPQGRNTHTWAWKDNANWVHGNHVITFGANYNASLFSPTIISALLRSIPWRLMARTGRPAVISPLLLEQQLVPPIASMPLRSWPAAPAWWAKWIKRLT